MNHRIRPGQVQARPSRLQADQKDRDVLVALETIHLPRPVHRAAIQIAVGNFAAVEFRLHKFKQGNKLAEDQHPVTSRDRLLQTVQEVLHFSGRLGPGFPILGQQAQVTAGLPQPHEDGENRNPVPAARLLTRKLTDLLAALFQDLAIDTFLLIGHFTPGHLLNLGGKILGHLGFGPTQQERANPLPQTVLGALIPQLGHRNLVPVPEIRGGAQVSGHEEIEDRPEIEEGIFQRRSGKHHPVLADQLLHGDGRLAGPVFNALRLVQHDRVKLQFFIFRNVPAQQRIAGDH